MLFVLLFVFLLILSFAVLFYFLKPSAMERAVAERLAGIDATSASAERTTILKDDATRSTFVDGLVGRTAWYSALSKLIMQSGKDWHASSVLLLSLGLVLAGGWIASLSVSSLVISIGIGLALGLSPLILLYILRMIRFRRFGDLLPDAVDLMSRGLRAGHSISAVLEMVGNEIPNPIGVEFRALSKEQSLGLPIREAITNLVERVPLDDMRFLSTAILLQKESGGNLSQILDKTSSVIRERARLRGQLRIYTAQGRITGWILCAAPFLMFGLISVVNHQYEKPLLTDPLGLKMVYGGLILMFIGVLIIRKIIDVKV